MIITYFKPKDIKNKFPNSPFDDNTFIFKTRNIKTHDEFLDILVDNCVLNLPLNTINRDIKSSRKMSDLKSLYSSYFDYILIDIDCKEKQNLYMILDYFSKYKATIFESRSFNNIDNFNIKIILDIETSTFKELKTLLAQIQVDLKDYCEVSLETIQKTQFTSAILKKRILKQYNGINFKIDKKTSDFVIKPNYDGVLKSKNKVDLCLELFNNLGFKVNRTNEDGSIVYFIKDDNPNDEYYWYYSYPYQLNHKNITKTINVYEIVYPYEEIDINFDNLFKIKPVGKEKVVEVDESILKINEDIKNLIEEFLHKKDSLFSIKSPMASGKSNIIEYIINESIERDFKVLLITNRVTVAEDFYERYKKFNFKFYQNKDYELDDNLIVQFDSLHYYNINNFDVVVLDEFTSLMIHSRSELPFNFFKSKEKKPENVVKFLSSFNKRVVIADAFLTDYENKIFNKKHSFKLINNYREDFKLEEIKNKNTFFWCLEDYISKLKPNKKLTISCVSDNMVGGIKEMIRLLHPNKKVVCLDSNTSELNRRLIYNSFEKFHHNLWDILIYSPTLTVGVSIKCDIDTHFHYDGCRAVDVISSLQMTRRSRNAREIIFFLGFNLNKLPLDEEIIRNNIVKNITPNSTFLCSLNDYGEIILTNWGQLVVKIDFLLNILFTKPSETFRYFLKYQFKNDVNINEIITKRSLNDFINKSKKEKDDFINKLLKTEYLESVGIDKDFINIFNGNSKDKIFSFFNSIKEKTTLDLPKDKDIFIELVNCIIKDRDFFNKIRLFKLLEQKPSLEEIKLLLSESIKNNNKKNVSLYNIIIKNNFILDLNLKYKTNKSNTFILNNLGFKKVKNDFILDSNILKFKDIIID